MLAAARVAVRRRVTRHEHLLVDCTQHPVYPDLGRNCWRPGSGHRNRGNRLTGRRCGPLAQPLLSATQEFLAMRILSSSLFWDKKFKIAILALATFIAMC